MLAAAVAARAWSWSSLLCEYVKGRSKPRGNTWNESSVQVRVDGVCVVGPMPGDGRDALLLRGARGTSSARLGAALAPCRLSPQGQIALRTSEYCGQLLSTFCARDHSTPPTTPTLANRLSNPHPISAHPHTLAPIHKSPWRTSRSSLSMVAHKTFTGEHG
jgi:hypothetical protein